MRYRLQQLADLSLPKLQQLDVSGNEVPNLKALTGVPLLKTLSATGCHLEVRVQSWSVMKCTLILWLQSIEGLPALEQLKTLNISDNNISSLKQLQVSTAAARLFLGSHGLRSTCRPSRC